MKCCIPEISWHNRDPVLSIDLQSKSADGLIRLATAGTDSHVLVGLSLIIIFAYSQALIASLIDSDMECYCGRKWCWNGGVSFRSCQAPESS